MPIFKKGDSNQASNYRPVSLLSQFSKVLAKLICNRLHHYLEKYNLLFKHQYGFRRNSSLTYTLCNIYAKLLKSADDSLYTCCVFLDLTKAFDPVDYPILLDKLECDYGIRGLVFSWWRAIDQIDNNTQKFLPVNQNWEKSHVESPKADFWAYFFSYCT